MACHDYQKSDFMLATNISYLQFKDKRANDMAFLYQMGQNVPRCMMDRAAESALWKDTYRTKTPFCSEGTMSRGNNMGCEPDRPCPKPMYSPHLLKDWLLTPCSPPIHKNYIVFGKNANGNEAYCSKQHQMFKNNTKRKDLTNREDEYMPYANGRKFFPPNLDTLRKN